MPPSPTIMLKKTEFQLGEGWFNSRLSNALALKEEMLNLILPCLLFCVYACTDYSHLSSRL